MNKKYSLLLLSALVLFSLVACQPKEDAPDVQAPEETEVETEVATPNEPRANAFDEYVEWNGLRLGVPTSWIGHYVQMETSTEDATNLIFYEEPDYSDVDCGHLFSLMLFKGNNPDDYRGLPYYEYRGELELADGQIYGVIAMYPTDVQASSEQQELYGKMYEDIPLMLDSLEPPAGAVLSPDKGGPDAEIIQFQNFFDPQEKNRFLLTADESTESQVFDFGDCIEITHCHVYDEKCDVSYKGTVIFDPNCLVINPTGDTGIDIIDYCFFSPDFMDPNTPDYIYGNRDGYLYLHGYIQVASEQGPVTSYREIYTP